MHVLAFGDLQTELWGVTWLPGDETQAQLALRAGAAGSQLDVILRTAAMTEPWTLKGDGVSLEFAPAAEAGEGRDAEGQLAAQGQLCQLSGRVVLDGSEVEVDCLGWRTATTGESDLGQLDSFRFLAGWLEPDVWLLASGPAPGQGTRS